MGSKVKVEPLRELFRDVFQITTFYVGCVRFQQSRKEDTVAAGENLQILEDGNQKLEEANRKLEEANRKLEESNKKLEKILAGMKFARNYSKPRV